MSVRWDAVVKNPTYWSSRREEDRARAGSDVEHAAASIEVQVWLFGRLVGPEVANPVGIQCAAGATVRDVIDELGRRLGPEFLSMVLNESGESLETCRVFLDGEAAGGMAAPIPCGSDATRVEIILFREIEGG